MATVTASIPVDLRNPGQVLACMGFVEAAEALVGGVECHFDWSRPQACFVLAASGETNPFEAVLDFLATASVVELTPIGYVEGGVADSDYDDGEDDATPARSQDEDGGEPAETQKDASDAVERLTAPVFPSGEGDRNSLPIQLGGAEKSIRVSHWADGSSRNGFKLYSGNRSASGVALQMLHGTRHKPKRGQSVGDAKTRGVAQLWKERREALIESPFDEVTPMGGSFNFDPRGAWTAIDAGYSPNTQKDGVAASPVVEILAAIGLEHARPAENANRKVKYAVWGHPLPPMLARAALAGAELKVPMRRFEFKLDMSGKNKVTTFAREEPQR